MTDLIKALRLNSISTFYMRWLSQREYRFAVDIQIRLWSHILLILKQSWHVDHAFYQVGPQLTPLCEDTF